MVTMIPQIPEPPTPQDPPAQFNQKAADSWAGLYAAVPKMNQQAEEIAQIGAAATAAAGQAAVDSDLALGYKNEAGAARTAAQGAAATAGQHAATAAQAGDDAAQAAVRAEEAAAAAGQRVPMTGMSGAAILPEGTDAERPAPGATGLYLRLSKTSGKPEWYNRAKSAWQHFGDASGELFNYAWHNGPRSSIDVGRVPTDGQQLLLLTHPDVCQAIWDGKQNSVTEAEWQADPTKRNCWSRGDGTSWVRVPDLNAAVAGTNKPFYLRGGPDNLNGTSVGDAIRNITGSVAEVVGPDGGTLGNGALGSVRTFLGATTGGSTSRSYNTISFNASASVPTADENRVKTAYGVMTVRVFTEVSNVGALDAGQLATQLGVVEAKVQALDANTGFTIIYLNGGTEAAPAQVAANSRYVIANPFPGRHVLCVAEVMINGAWGDAGWDGNTGQPTSLTWGTRASYLPSSDSVVVQTGNTGVAAASNLGGGGHGYSGSSLPSAFGRVKVWNLKG